MNERPARVDIPWSRAEWRQCRRCGSPTTTFSDYGGSCWACLDPTERGTCCRAERGELDAGEVRDWLLRRTATDGQYGPTGEGCSV